jgi:hypothetical protein
VDLGVVDEAVDHGGDDGLVAEDLSPANWGWHLFPGEDLSCDLPVSGSWASL